MADFEITPKYTKEIRKLEPTDRGHADVFNAIFSLLVNNDAHFMERFKQIVEDIQELVEEIEKVESGFQELNPDYFTKQVPLNKGGTGATTAAQALINLGAAAAAHTHNYAGSSTVAGIANSAHKLATGRSINGTIFDGTGNISTANWGTSRTLTVGNTGKAVNGSGNVAWSLADIGAAAASHTHNYAAASHTHNYAGSASAGGAANSANQLATARSINGTAFNGTGNISTANWGATRTITIGNSGKNVNGSGNVAWSLAEIGAAKTSHDHISLRHIEAEFITGKQFIYSLNINSQSCFPGDLVADNKLSLGTSGNRFSVLYAGTGSISTSDRNEKEDIKGLKETDSFILGLKPVSYKMKDGTSGRTHYGLIAQDVEVLMSELKMDSKDFAGFIKSPKMIQIEDEKTKETKFEEVEGEYDYGLRYEEFISPMIATIQHQQKEIDELKLLVNQLIKQ